jgi:alpha-ketoglutarate-dependent taurine dioxygenase
MERSLEVEPLLETHFADVALPLVVRPARKGAMPDHASLSRCADRALSRVGALLFRGFAVRSIAAFDHLVKALTPALLTYEFGSTPRSRVEGKIYTSTEYPAHQTIPQHNEQSYTSEWPLKIWFHCVTASPEGGSTPLSDSRAVYKRIDPRVRARFIDKQVMYVRNYGNGLDVPWQQVFGTDDRVQVERYCARAGILCEWKADGELRTRQVCPAVAQHPRTGEWVWFNQAHLFHVTNLEPVVQEGLLSILDDDELPRNAFYGDGTAIEPAALAEVRAAYQAETHSFAWQAGDVLLVDNMLVAHGRAPFRGPRKVVVAMAEPCGIRTS